jgi:hypothetical protein
MPAFYVFYLYAPRREPVFPLKTLFYSAFSGLSVRNIYPVLFRYLGYLIKILFPFSSDFSE